MKNIIEALAGRVLKKRSFKDKWYEDEPILNIGEEKKKQLKKRGFLTSSDLVFDFETYSYQEYITHRDYWQMHPVNKSFSRLIDNKAFIPVLFRNDSEFLPELCISVDQGFVNYAYGIASDSGNLETLLQKSLKKYQELFLKPINNSGGKNTVIINSSNLDCIVEELQKGKYSVIINNRLKSEEYSSKIYDGAINTMRVIFFRPNNQRTKLFRMFHRFGTLESGSVDNCGKGGMVSSIDAETGTLGKAVIYASKKYNGRYERHINTGMPLDGFGIPDWEHKLQCIKKIIKNLDYLDYGGIDIAPTDKGLKVIEVNSLPSITITQMKKPALLDQEFKQFIYSKGYGAR